MRRCGREGGGEVEEGREGRQGGWVGWEEARWDCLYTAN